MFKEFEEEEKKIQIEFENSKNQLQLLSNNLLIKEQYEYILNQIDLTKNKTKKIKNLKDQYKFDNNIIKKQKKIHELYSKNLLNYSIYNPEINNFEYTKKEKVQKNNTNINHLESSEVISINDIESNVLYTWDDLRWSGVNELPFDCKVSGIGPGELRLSKIFGGYISGYSQHYDLTLPDDTKWEVKYLATNSDKIRTGTNSRKIVERINNILKELFEIIRNQNDQSKAYVYANQFIDDHYELMIEKGEISTNKWKILYGIMKCTNQDIKYWFDKIMNEINYDLIFEDISGIFIVNKKGFYLVRKELFNTSIHFSHISQKLIKLDYDFPKTCN